MKTIDLTKMVEFVINGGQVRRWHTWPVIKEDSVAAHSFGVAWWCILIYNFRPGVFLLMAALQHDLTEFATGDMPAQVKLDEDLGRAMGVLEQRSLDLSGMPLAALTEEEQLVLVFADKLDGITCMVRERRFGNRTTGLVVHRTQIYLGTMLGKFKSEPLRNNAEKLLNVMVQLWRNALGEVSVL